MIYDLRVSLPVQFYCYLAKSANCLGSERSNPGIPPTGIFFPKTNKNNIINNYNLLKLRKEFKLENSNLKRL